MKHMIYTSELDYEGAEEFLEEDLAQVKDVLKSLEGKGRIGKILLEACEKRIEALKEEEAGYAAEFQLDCERDNLDQETDGEIVIVANLGLWDGRHSAVKNTGKHNLNAVLGAYGGVDEFEVFVEDGEVRGFGHHHDGTNKYLFREVVDQDAWEKLSAKIYLGKDWEKSELDKATKPLADRVNKIYGWED